MSTVVKREEITNEPYKKKLIKVLSTKVTREDSRKFRVLTTLGYQNGAIKDDSPSEM